MGVWQAEAVTVKGPNGDWQIAAWRRGYFALDWRPICNDDTADDVDAYGAWAVTHVPTGYSAGAIVGRFVEASQFAEALEREADWNFDSPDMAWQRAEAVKAVLARTGVRRISVGHVQMPQGGAE